MNTAITDPHKLALWEAIRDGKSFQAFYNIVSGPKITQEWVDVPTKEVVRYVTNPGSGSKYRIKPTSPRSCWVAFSLSSGAVFVVHNNEDIKAIEEEFNITSSGWHKVEDK